MHCLNSTARPISRASTCLLHSGYWNDISSVGWDDLLPFACLPYPFFFPILSPLECTFQKISVKDGEWGCCPFPNAVCCADNIHCCPEDTTCDRGRRDHMPRPKKQVPERRPFRSGSTCCLLVSGRYGCCPVEGANCCADHLHCCPRGFSCDASGQRCIQEKVIGSYRKFPGTPIRSKPAVDMHNAEQEDDVDDELEPISCGYGTTCPASSTCCKVSSLGRIHHMCCPLQNAVCCEEVCCPAGYHCRQNGRCEKRALRDFFGDIDF
ncbi:unnamed protein product [Heligmosomoides polygyrus]|uniref:Granulins domain-containing protein n=1 Tax=Heligmosomoides polygyrus TaxID=6339 RepID=A0A3P7YQE1_HELPZ|nr:unnamed protein product [Heligmosomoides polygyrus]